jgi:hypothetical protein
MFAGGTWSCLGPSCWSWSRIPLFTYYSFTTLTTVGYGDVTPLSTAARTCAWLEALTGQFYLAVLVAGLVGALLSGKSESGDAE